MLDREQLINKLMRKLQTFSEVEKVEVVEVKMASMKTQDGKELVIVGDEIATGLEIYETVDGNRVDLANGEYILTDGRAVIIESNFIKEIKEVEPAKVDIEVEPAEIEMCGTIEDKKMTMEDPRIGELETKVADLEKQLMDLMMVMDGTMSKAEKMSERLNKIANEPAETPFITKQVELSTDNKAQNRADLIKKILEASKK